MQSRHPQSGLEKSKFRNVWFPYFVMLLLRRKDADVSSRKILKFHRSQSQRIRPLKLTKRPQQQREGERVLKVRPRCSPHRKTWILTQWGILIAFTSSSGAARSPDDGWCVLTGRWTFPVVAGHVRASGGAFALVRIHTRARARSCVLRRDETQPVISRKGLDQQSNRENK